jgi:hypothetical protein
MGDGGGMTSPSLHATRYLLYWEWSWSTGLDFRLGAGPGAGARARAKWGRRPWIVFMDQKLGE